MSEFFFNSIILLRDVIFRPVYVFRSTSEGENEPAIAAIFAISCLITLLKSFGRKKYHSNFFNNQNINKFIDFISNPQLSWAITLISYCLFIFLIKRFGKLLYGVPSQNKLVMNILSISSAGLILQVVFLIFPYLLSQNLVYMLRHIAYIWIVSLTVAAIKVSQELSYRKSVIVFALASLPPILIIGLPGIAPYTSWLIP